MSSGDDIVFDEIQYREPVRRVRPDRDKRYACAAYQVPGPNDLPIFLDHQSADAIERHALSDTTVELGGILLGKECVDEATGSLFVWITQSLEAKHYANTQASFTYTHDSWEEITRERDKRFPDLDIVGWYHTHPSFGIFLSHHDVFIHQHFFVQPLQVAYVVDPIQLTRGFFHWRDRSLSQVEGFYLTAERGDRMALARVANELENLPSPQGPGGALSPRLEAELIKMLSRPSAPQYASTPIDRFQIAAVFGMLGSFLGVLGVAAALWLYQLHGRLQEQSEALKAMAGSVEKVAGGQQLAVDTLLERAGAETPKDFAARYERLARDREELKRQLLAQKSINETLGTRTKDLEQLNNKLAGDFDLMKAKLEEYQADAKLAPDLQTQVADLKKLRTRLENDLSEKSRIAETVEGKQADEVLRRADFYKYATYFTGTLSAVLGLLLFWLYARLQMEPEPGPRPSEHQTHRIS